MIIDFDNMDMFDALQTFVNNVKSDLFEAILSKKGNFELCASSIWTFVKINFKLSKKIITKVLSNLEIIKIIKYLDSIDLEYLISNS